MLGATFVFSDLREGGTAARNQGAALDSAGVNPQLFILTGSLT